MACFIQTILQNRPKYFRRWKYVPQICPVWNHQNQLILSLFQWKKLVLSARIRLNKKKMISKDLHFSTVKDTIFHSFYNFGLKIPLNTTKLPKIDLQALKMFYLSISNELWQNSISLKFCYYIITLPNRGIIVISNL